MGKKDPRVSAYILKAPPYARPILKYLRKTIHAALPGVTETIRWQSPHFDCRGPICYMAAFKNHCAFGFWKSRLIFADEDASAEAMGQFGRIASMADLPSKKELSRYLRKAARFNETGVKSVASRPARKKKLKVPADLKSELRRNAKAGKAFENFSYTNRKEYAEWISGAKRPETRRRRLATALQWIAQGKVQNWRYL